jgi:hypothetical protein
LLAIFVLWSGDCVVYYSRQGLDRPLDIIVGFASVSLDPTPQMSRLDWFSVVVVHMDCISAERARFYAGQSLVTVSTCR